MRFFYGITDGAQPDSTDYYAREDLARASAIYTELLRVEVAKGAIWDDDIIIDYLLPFARRIGRGLDCLQKLDAPMRLKQLTHALRPAVSLIADDECCICLDTILPEEEDDARPAIGRVLKCGHVFHRACIEEAGDCPYRCVRQ
jgi:hypothetical protein